MKEKIKTNLDEEEIILAPPTELFDEAKEIAETTTSDQKFPFDIQYNVEQKEFLLSMLQTVGAVVEAEDEKAEEYTFNGIEFDDDVAVGSDYGQW